MIHAKLTSDVGGTQYLAIHPGSVPEMLVRGDVERELATQGWRVAFENAEVGANLGPVTGPLPSFAISKDKYEIPTIIAVRYESPQVASARLAWLIGCVTTFHQRLSNLS